jgi:homoserine kinase type II
VWLDDLRTVLARYPAIVRPCGSLEALGGAGGGSGARLWRFPTGRGTLVARLWPPEWPDRTTLERIHRWLDLVSDLEFVPVPLEAHDGRTVQELRRGLWELSPWLVGLPATRLSPSADRLRAGYAALAAFHQRLAREPLRGPSPGLRARIIEIEKWRGGDFAALANILARSAACRSRDHALRWLDQARRMAPRILEPLHQAAGLDVVLQPCLRDARPEHLLFVDDRVTGLLDFGAMGIECVAADLARLLSEWPGPDRSARANALEAYAAVRPLDLDEIALIDVFESSSALLGGGHWVRWHFIEGREFSDPMAVERGIERGVERLCRLAGGFR